MNYSCLRFIQCVKSSFAHISSKFLILCLLGLFGSKVSAQQVSDTLYYQTFPDKVTSRIYVSRKFTDFKINDRVSNESFLIKPNSSLNLGMGATYNGLTFNLAYGFGFLNPERDRGETNYIDLQAHAYPKNLIIDVFLQFYRGYYLEKVYKTEDYEQPIFLLPDVRVKKIGLNVQYLFNGEKLSLRAAFLQSEWQKKSAGSFLAGVEIYGGGAENDSPIVPTLLLQDPERNFSQFRYFDFGPNLGYVYTLVIKKHYFITAAATSNLGVGWTSMETIYGKESRWGLNPNVFLRGFAGYNSERWSINGNYIWNNVRLTRVNGFSNTVMTGNYRVNFVYRFSVGPKIKRYLDFTDLRRYL